MNRCAWLALALLVGEPAPVWHLAVAGLTDEYLEPCGCGGRYAGGLARRASQLADLRRHDPDLLVLDVGGQGREPALQALTVRALARMGVDAVGATGDDLADWSQLGPRLAEAGLPATSLVDPAGGPRPARSLVLGPAGQRLGLVSLALRDLGNEALAERLTAELTRLRQVDGCRATVVISHLGYPATKDLLGRLTLAARPTAILLGTSYDQSQPVFEELGTTWIPVSWRGRSLSLVTLTPTRVESEQYMVLAGPTDPIIDGWVNAYTRARLAGEQAAAPAGQPSFPPVAACQPCHGAAVDAWRRTPHARAVTTLTELGRDVAACLRCHSETLRRDGLRPGDGDQGVVCASCHDRLTEHLAAPAEVVPGGGQELCVACHTPENSPGWDAPAYLARVLAACRGEAGD